MQRRTMSFRRETWVESHNHPTFAPVSLPGDSANHSAENWRQAELSRQMSGLRAAKAARLCKVGYRKRGSYVGGIEGRNLWGFSIGPCQGLEWACTRWDSMRPRSVLLPWCWGKWRYQRFNASRHWSLSSARIKKPFWALWAFSWDLRKVTL